jgi:hypothetical protein
MFNQAVPGPPAPQVAQYFLRLLDDVSRIQQLLLDETVALRARVRELEAGAQPGSGPAGDEGRRP